MLFSAKKFLLPLLLAGALAAPAAAQQAPVLWEGAASHRAITDLLFDKPAGRGAAPAAGTTLPFRRDPAVTRRAEAATVRQVRDTNPAAADRIEALFASQDVLAAWGQAMQVYGLSLDNVADALTANWLVLYLAGNQLSEPPPATQVAGLRRQLRRVCTLPGLANLKTAAQRQQLADYLHLQSLLLNQAQTEAEKAGSAAVRATVAQQARQIAQQNMGFDPTTVRLTAQGLVRK